MKCKWGSSSVARIQQKGRFPTAPKRSGSNYLVTVVSTMLVIWLWPTKVQWWCIELMITSGFLMPLLPVFILCISRTARRLRWRECQTGVPQSFQLKSAEKSIKTEAFWVNAVFWVQLLQHYHHSLQMGARGSHWVQRAVPCAWYKGTEKKVSNPTSTIQNSQFKPWWNSWT